MIEKNNKIYLFLGFLTIGFLLLIGRLFELQIIFGNHNRALAEGNRIKKEVIPAPRGIIYDRQGKELVRNVPIYRLKMETEDCEEQAPCFKVISRQEALNLGSNNQTDNLRMDIGRDYLYGETLAHLLGYLSEANQQEVESNEYQLGDLVGRMGIEQEYDHWLRGQDGGEIYEVDAYGNKIRLIGRVESQAGRDLHLSIDAHLSEVAFQALDGQPGAVVASDPNNGQIITLVSSPSFNPDLMNKSAKVNEQEREKIESFLKDPLKPFFNRAIGGVYPPGSTFKIVTSIAGLEEGKIDESTIFEDTGQIVVGDYSFRNWYFTQYGRTEGEVNIVKAMKRSVDTFFYKVGEWVGPSQLSKWASSFGLGQKTEIDLPGEVAGFVPSPDNKEELTGERWFLGNTYHFAIGQGDLLVTPLQINLLTAVIAKDGSRCQPEINTNLDKNCQNLKLSDQSLELVKEGMREACSSGGTGYPFFNFSVPVFCKTGTAEFGDPDDKTHAWFTAFITDKPEIVVTSLVEKGGEGSEVAAPIAKQVIEAWLNEN